MTGAVSAPSVASVPTVPIPFFDLAGVNGEVADEVRAGWDELVRTGRFIGGAARRVSTYRSASGSSIGFPCGPRDEAPTGLSRAAALD